MYLLRILTLSFLVLFSYITKADEPPKIYKLSTGSDGEVELKMHRIRTETFNGYLSQAVYTETYDVSSEVVDDAGTTYPYIISQLTTQIRTDFISSVPMEVAEAREREAREAREARGAVAEEGEPEEGEPEEFRRTHNRIQSILPFDDTAVSTQHEIVPEVFFSQSFLVSQSTDSTPLLNRQLIENWQNRTPLAVALEMGGFRFNRFILNAAFISDPVIMASDDGRARIQGRMVAYELRPINPTANRERLLDWFGIRVGVGVNVTIDVTLMDDGSARVDNISSVGESSPNFTLRLGEGGGESVSLPPTGNVNPEEVALPPDLPGISGLTLQSDFGS